MGSWGSGPFDNDGGLDSLLDMFETRSGATRSDYRDGLRQGLAAVADGEGPLDPDTVAGARAGGPAPGSYTAEKLLAECPFEVDDDLVRLAARAMDRALEERDNELWLLWDEAGTVEDVRAALAPFRAALGP